MYNNSLNKGYPKVEYLVTVRSIVGDDDSGRMLIGRFGGYGRSVYHAKKILRVLAEAHGDKPYEEELKTSLNYDGFPLWYGSTRDSSGNEWILSVFPKM